MCVWVRAIMCVGVCGVSFGAGNINYCVCARVRAPSFQNVFMWAPHTLKLRSDLVLTHTHTHEHILAERILNY